jgi:putative hydrolases of HD superfamily
MLDHHHVAAAEFAAAEVVDEVIGLGRLALAFGQVPRITYHPDGITPESDTTHTVMLGLLACALAARCAPHLDLGRIAQYALLHDLPEVYAGDTATLREPSPEQQADKAHRELQARRRIAREHTGLPWLAATLDAYERQDSPEARWVKAIDKLAPKIAHLLNHGATIREQGLTTQQVADRYARQGSQVAAYTGDFPVLAQLREHLVDRLIAALDSTPQPRPRPAGRPYRLEIVTDPDPEQLGAVACFKAPSTAAAYRHSRQLLAAHHGPDDRYGELYAADGEQPAHLDTIHLGA